jgi:hypothetical protein
MSTTDDTGTTARRLVEGNRYMTLATADADGRPWVTPVWYAPEWPEALLWISRPDTRHSQNLAVRPELAIVVFDSTVPVGGAEALYLDARAEQLSGAEMERGMAVFSAHSLAGGAGSFGVEHVSGDGPFRLYRATVLDRFVLGPGDRRLPVTPLS